VQIDYWVLILNKPCLNIMCYSVKLLTILKFAVWKVVNYLATFRQNVVRYHYNYCFKKVVNWLLENCSSLQQRTTTTSLQPTLVHCQRWVFAFEYGCNVRHFHLRGTTTRSNDMLNISHNEGAITSASSISSPGLSGCDETLFRQRESRYKFWHTEFFCIFNFILKSLY
jgi:hypothetical protein